MPAHDSARAVEQPRPCATEAKPLPFEARRSLFIYNLFFPLVFLALLPGFLARMFKRGGYREKFSQRFGRYSAADCSRFAERKWIWCHSISVGETLLALKLAREIHALAPEKGVVISVTTSTGFAVAQPHTSDWLHLIYNPLDLPFVVRRALAAIRPARLVFIEAMWPNVLAEAKRSGIPVGFLPRLSPRSEKRFRRFRFLTGPLFRLIDVFALADAVDVPRWKSLGAAGERLHVTGNCKFDQPVGGASRAGEFRQLLRQLGCADTALVLLAGSTFPGEERLIAEVFRELRAEFPQLFLIIVPRHVERTEQVLRDLKHVGCRIALRSTITPQTGAVADILLVNTTGELRDWYSVSTVVFIGKSILASGGQNPVEPVLAGCPVIFGPHMENFEPIVTQWLDAEAAIRVSNQAELQHSIAGLLRDHDRRRALVDRAAQIAAAHQGATRRTAARLLS